MQQLQQTLQERAVQELEVLQQGVTRTEAKLQRCLEVLAAVQHEVAASREAQAATIERDYHACLEQLTLAYEQQVRDLESATRHRLADAQTAADETLRQAAELLLQELSAPASAPSPAAAGPGSPGPAGLGELSLLALPEPHAPQPASSPFSPHSQRACFGCFGTPSAAGAWSPPHGGDRGLRLSCSATRSRSSPAASSCWSTGGDGALMRRRASAPAGSGPSCRPVPPALPRQQRAGGRPARSQVPRRSPERPAQLAAQAVLRSMASTRQPPSVLRRASQAAPSPPKRSCCAAAALGRGGSARAGSPGDTSSSDDGGGGDQGAWPPCRSTRGGRLPAAPMRSVHRHEGRAACRRASSELLDLLDA